MTDSPPPKSQARLQAEAIIAERFAPLLGDSLDPVLELFSEMTMLLGSAIAGVIEDDGFDTFAVVQVLTDRPLTFAREVRNLTRQYDAWKKKNP